MNMESPLCYGIDGESGAWLAPPPPWEEALAFTQREVLSAEHAKDLRLRAEHGKREVLGLAAGADPSQLAKTGWGVIFPPGGDPEVEEALRPLLEHRKAQAHRRFRRLILQPGEHKSEFLARHRQGPGPVDPHRIPYYLLLVGSPEEIPFEFQYHLGVQFAVGRLHFDGRHRYDCYRRYAENVVRAESGIAALSRRMALFAPKHQKDLATQLVHNRLVRPLARQLDRQVRGWLRPWKIETVLGEDARRERWLRFFEDGGGRPSLLFHASHGLSFPQGLRQKVGQGGLLCQGWKGPGHCVAPEHWVGGRDLLPRRAPSGLVAFFFACFSAGTPAVNDFLHRGPGEQLDLAPAPFIARLPQRLLSHPNGGALAVVGHVDRAWRYSYDWPVAGPQVQTFEGAFLRLLEGGRLGWAMEPFSQRYAELAVDLMTKIPKGQAPGLLDTKALLTAFYDARNFVVLGDPAVRLPAAQCP